MNRKQLGLLSLAVVLLSTTLQAQEKRNLTVEEAVSLSIQNNHRLKAAAARVAQATAQLHEAYDSRLPQADVQGGYLRVNQPNISMKSGNGSGGGSGEEVSVSQAMYGMLNLSLPIYTGGKIKYGIESARYLAEAAALDADYQQSAIASNTVSAFINLFKATRAVDLMKESLLQSQERVREFANLEKNGLLARNDFLKAQLQASNKELALLDAQNNLQLAIVNMNLMLGLPDSTSLVPDSTGLFASHALEPLETYLQAATHRRDVEKLDYQQKAARVAVKSVQADKYPNLALTGGYVALNLPGFLSVTNAVNIGVGVKYNIASLWKGKAKVREAEARVSELAATQAQLGNDVKLEVTRQYLSLISSQKKTEVYRQAIEQADENYRITKNKYDNSLATTTELLDADVAQLEAKVNLIYARADEAALYTQLLESAGLLGQNPSSTH